MPRLRFNSILCALAFGALLCGCRQAAYIPQNGTASAPVNLSAVPETPALEAAVARLPDPEIARLPDAGKVIPTIVEKTPPPAPAPEGMVWIPPTRFSMGSDYEPFLDAQPIHTVELDGFYMDRHLVTNTQFARFVKATGYITIAERKPDPKEFPGVLEERLVPGAVVFLPPAQAVTLGDISQWWQYLPGANWRHPEGPGSDLKGRDSHPVVHVCWEDATAYAKWAGKRLPTEAEWECAARGGLTQKPYVWGEKFQPEGKPMANTYQGRFPDSNTKADGWERTSPVGSYPPNRFGLYDMAGNVWQWCSDWYRPDYYAHSPRKNPTGPPDSFDPQEPEAPKRVQRGGSFLCTDQYCSRYMPGGRGKGDIYTGSSHVGFRCVVSGSRLTGVRKVP
jgi:formylglycine-generating enzyme